MRTLNAQIDELNAKNSLLRDELQATQSHLTVATSRERSIQASQEDKFRLILAKVNTLDQELVATR
jgi:hypothetical protein